MTIVAAMLIKRWLRFPGCSIALLDEVCSHFLDKLEAILHILELSIAVLLILSPHSNDDCSGSLAYASSSTSGGQLTESLLVILVGQHKLLSTHSAACLTWVSVSISDTDSTFDLVHGNILARTVHLLERVLVSC